MEDKKKTVGIEVPPRQLGWVAMLIGCICVAVWGCFKVVESMRLAGIHGAERIEQLKNNELRVELARYKVAVRKCQGCYGLVDRQGNLEKDAVTATEILNAMTEEMTPKEVAEMLRLKGEKWP